MIAAERLALADTLDDVGPRAPTLAGSWTAADIATHVASLDSAFGLPTFIGRSIVARTGARLNDVARPLSERALRRLRRKGFAWAVERIRRPPPALLVRPSVSAIGLFEVFVHHEDIRRARDANDVRDAPDELAAALPWLLRSMSECTNGGRDG